MLLAQRKKTYCQNCQYPLVNNYNFCPNCGQENTDKLVSFGTLITEFFGNYLAYDSRLVRTIRPFLFKPGFLTTEFIEGRRTKYMHPLRLYFIISFFYFLLFSTIALQGVNFNIGKTNNIAQKGGPNGQIISGDSLRKQIQEEVAKGLPQAERARADSIANSIEERLKGVSNTDSIISKAGGAEKKGSANVSFENVQWDELLSAPGITPEQVLDTIRAEKTYFNLLLARQGIKIYNEKGQNIASYLISKASVMMFLLLPFFALLLKLFYIRRKRLYIEHITFTLHLHCFLFFVLMVAMIVDYFWPVGWIFMITTLLIILYFVLAFKWVYKQSWVKTLSKMFILFFTYALSFSIFLAATIAISLLIF